jgi:hypothetical protein
MTRQDLESRNADAYSWYAVESCRHWLWAVVVLGERLVGAANAQMDLWSDASRSPSDADPMLQDLRTARDHMRMQEYFFVTATHKAREWFKEAAHFVPELAPKCAAFSGATHHASDIRDMREHEIEYFRGSGNRQHRFMHRDALGHVAADATASIINRNEYLIGNRLCVQLVIRAARESLPSVVKMLERTPRPQP